MRWAVSEILPGNDFMLMRRLFLLVCLLQGSKVMAEPYIVAHRGASGEAPENTLPAFELAWKQGADAIEGDFYLTADGEIVCMHDADTERTAGKKLVVAKSTLAELRELDVGSWKDARYAGTVAPTLAEVLATVPEGKKIFVEVKCGPEIVPRLLEDLAKSGLKAEQIVIISFKDDVIAEVRRLRPEYRANWLTALKEKNGKLLPTPDEIVATLKRTNATGLGIGFKEVDESLVRAVENAGFEFHVWTVDDPAVGSRFAEWGSRSITTNWPKRIREALETGGK